MSFVLQSSFKFVLQISVGRQQRGEKQEEKVSSHLKQEWNVHPKTNLFQASSYGLWTRLIWSLWSALHNFHISFPPFPPCLFTLSSGMVYESYSVAFCIFIHSQVHQMSRNLFISNSNDNSIKIVVSKINLSCELLLVILIYYHVTTGDHWSVFLHIAFFFLQIHSFRLIQTSVKHMKSNKDNNTHNGWLWSPGLHKQES